MARTAEEAILVVALCGDGRELEKRLRLLLPGERRTLERACGWIQQVLLRIEEEGGG